MLDDSSLRSTWSGARRESVWLDSPERPPARPALEADAETDLAVVGGGFTGLWTALMAKERQPDRTVLLLEGDRIGGAATGRNGGFCSASLTHGEENGRRRFPDEYDELQRLGMENLREITETVSRYGIGCDLIESGELHVATRHHELAALDTTSEDYLDVVAVRQQVDSPT